MDGHLNLEGFKIMIIQNWSASADPDIAIECFVVLYSVVAV